MGKPAPAPTLSQNLDQVLIVIEASQALPPSPARDESLAKWQRVKARLESGIDAN